MLTPPCDSWDVSQVEHLCSLFSYMPPCYLGAKWAREAARRDEGRRRRCHHVVCCGRRCAT